MSQFCRNCGTKMDDGNLFCPHCGVQVVPVVTNAPTPANPIYTEPTPPHYEKRRSNIAQKAKSLFRKPPFVAVLIALLILAIGFSLLKVGTVPYEKALSVYFDTVIAGQVEQAEDLVPGKVWKNYTDRTGYKKAELLDVVEVNCKIWSDHYFSDVGGNLSYSHHVDSEEEISNRKLKLLKAVLEDTYEINSDHVKTAYEIKVTATIKGKRNQTHPEWELLVVHIDDAWYLLRLVDRDTMEVAFLVEEHLQGSF